MVDSLFKKKDKRIILTDILMGIMLLIWKLLWISDKSMALSRDFWVYSFCYICVRAWLVRAGDCVCVCVCGP